MGPLEGLRVIDLGRIMAGPVCGLMLADLGADVVKVESLPSGDPSRRFLPPSIGDESAAFMMMNRNKRGVAVDLRTDQGRAVLWTLLATADVLIENFRAGTMDQMGLGYDSIRDENPGSFGVRFQDLAVPAPWRSGAGSISRPRDTAVS